MEVSNVIVSLSCKFTSPVSGISF